MTLALENEIANYLRSMRPREGFAAELFAELTHDPQRIHPMFPIATRSRTRWIVAGAVAGVVSATGAVYLGSRLRHRGVA